MSVLLAFCSLYYELAFGQVLSVCLGGTKNQYFLTIGIFTCFLGFGSLFQKRFRNRYGLKKTFLTVELLLTILGSMGPFVITWILSSGGNLMGGFGTILAYTLIASVGFLSGFEIPCLFSMAPDNHGKVLAFDYLGMLLATVAFPFLILPHLGTGAGTLLVAGANAFVLLWIRSPDASLLEKTFTRPILVFVFASIIFFRSQINEGLSLLYLKDLM